MEGGWEDAARCGLRAVAASPWRAALSSAGVGLVVKVAPHAHTHVFIYPHTIKHAQPPRHLDKADGELGMLVVKIGGPAYRIGMGGGAASSVPSGSNSADLDFNAVQRGDAEMSQKLWRVVRRCARLLVSRVIGALVNGSALRSSAEMRFGACGSCS